MFKPFRRRRGSTAPSVPPAVETDQSDFDRAWADYVEWSGLDEDQLPDSPQKDDRP